MVALLNEVAPRAPGRSRPYWPRAAEAAGHQAAGADALPPELFQGAFARIRVQLPGEVAEHNADRIEGGAFIWDIDLTSMESRQLMATTTATAADTPAAPVTGHGVPGLKSDIAVSASIEADTGEGAGSEPAAETGSAEAARLPRERASPQRPYSRCWSRGVTRCAGGVRARKRDYGRATTAARVVARRISRARGRGGGTGRRVGRAPRPG